MEIRTPKTVAHSLAVVVVFASLAIFAALYLAPARGNHMYTKTVQVTVDARTLAGNDLHAIIEPVWAAVDAYASDAEYQSSVRRFSQGQRYLLALQFYRGEMADGGHHAVLSNASNTLLENALAAFRVLRLHDAATILSEAWQLAGGPTVSTDCRLRSLGTLQPDDLSTLDRRYFELDRGDTVDSLALSFARSRPEEFYFTGPVQKGVE